MKKKTPMLWLFLGIALALLAGCMQPLLGDGDALQPHMWKGLAQGVESAPVMCGTPTVVTLFAGQTINVGTVTVTNDAANLYVTYATGNGWLLYETHLAVATSLAGIPQKNGNPEPGQFDYKDAFDPPVSMYTYVIQRIDPVNHVDWTEGLTLYIAAHAVVKLQDGGGNLVQEETAWGDGTDFPGKNWATYFTYIVQGCGSEPPPLVWDFRTQTQGGWGAPAHGNNPGVYRDLNFAGAFPEGLVIGIDGPGTDSAKFSTAAAIEAFLPAGGKPGPLGGDSVDITETAAGVLAGQVVALTLNVGFDLYDPNFSPSDLNLKDLVVAEETSPCYGWTVAEVLVEADKVLGGDPAATLTPEQINDCAARINEDFVDGVVDLGFLMLQP